MIQPNKLRVIVLPDDRVTETSSGLYVGDHYNPDKGLRRGTVKSVGNGCKELREGDRVGFMAYTGLPVLFEGTRYLSMFESEVEGVFTQE